MYSLVSLWRKLYPLMLISLIWACEESGPSPISTVLDMGLQHKETWWMTDSFNDHTAKQLLSRADFTELAKTDNELQVLKFWLSEPDFGLEEGWSEQALIRFYDSRFYTLHDQLYWFRLLNGAPVWTFDTNALEPGLNIDHVEALSQHMFQWQAEGKPLPLELKFTASNRLYAPKFYEAVLSHPRRTIVGSIIHLDPHPQRNAGQELWAFELEYSDKPTLNEIISIFAYFKAHLPEEMKHIKWLTRSPYQGDLAQLLINQDVRYQEQVISYDDLVIIGEASVYSEGITAGRIHLMEDVHEPSQERDILIYQSLPDDLPSCRGLLSTIPQTPLAHLNLLARNRAIPNLYVGGLAQNPSIAQLSRVRAPAVLWAQAPDRWRLVPLTSEEYQRYINLKSKPMRDVERPEVNTSPYWLDGSELSVSELLDLRPLLGGKASGVLLIDHVINQAGNMLTNPMNDGMVESGNNETESTNIALSVKAPQPIFALTGRAYAEHLQVQEDTIRNFLDRLELPEQRVQLILFLEGWAGVWARNLSSTDRDKLRTWFNQETEEVQAVILAGGIQTWIKTTVINTATLRAIVEQLNSTFAELSPYQGLRFRSSSNVEDLEGFNGAGLYESFTAYLYPQHQADADEQQKTIAYALKALWASYWNLEAFEERELEGIDHLSGWMAALIHPNFQDELELSNGVMTVTLLPQVPQKRGHLFLNHNGESPIARVILNSQLGSESVTNPSSPELLTEVIEVQVYQSIDDELRFEIEYIQNSSLSPEVLKTQSIIELVKKALKVTLVWQNSDNERLNYTQQYQALTLDFEYREMSPTWPLKHSSHQDDNTEQTSQMILKQARPLEPAQLKLPSIVSQAAFPLDLQRRSLRVQRWSCKSAQLSLSALQLYTDPLATPNMDFNDYPFTGEISYIDHRPNARNPNQEYRLSHQDYLVVNSSSYEQELQQHWQLELYRRAGRNLPFEHIKLDLNQGKVWWTARQQSGELVSPYQETIQCNSEMLFASPKDYLLSILKQAQMEHRGFGNE